MSRSDRARPGKRLCALTLAVSLLLLAAVGVGCSSKPKGTSSTSSSSATSPTGTSPVTKPPTSTVPLVLSGTGTTNTDAFTLTAGLAVFQVVYSGGANCQASLLDASGKTVSVLYNLNRNTTGSTALGVTAGRYSISTTATGSWQINVVQQIPVSPQFIPVFTNGIGPLVTPFFQSNGGNATVTMTYAGTAPFVVTLLTSSGSVVSTVANASTGPFNGTQTVFLRQNVIYLIDVEGDGSWTLTVQ